jgi:DNA-binding ferritin-like protein (Dps family)
MILNESVKIVKRPDKILVYFSDEGDVFETNNIGLFILGKIIEGLDEAEIVDALAEETNESRDVIGKDIQEFFTILKENGVILNE